MEETKPSTFAVKSEYINTQSCEINCESQSLYEPFVSSRKLEKLKLDPYANIDLTQTLPGFEIPDKPQNLPRPGEVCGEGFIRTDEVKKPIKTNSHEPSQWIPLGERMLSIHPVHHELGSEVLGVRFENRIEIHALRLRTVKNDEFFTLQKVQELRTGEKDFICAMAIGFNSNIGIGGKKLVYAFALHDQATVYYVKDEPVSILSFQPTLKVTDINFVKCFDKDGIDSGSIQALTFDGENGKYLASLRTDAVCKVWNVEIGRVHGILTLESEGVAVRFHRSEPNKIMVAERSGWIKFYDLQRKMVTVSSVFATASPLFTADWPPCDPTGAAAGVLNRVHLFRQIDRNCEHFRIVENRGLNSIIRYCPSDRFLFAALTRYKNGLRMFHTQVQTPIWVQLDKEVQWIEWVYGKPFLMACVGENIEFYEATAY